MDAVHCCHHTVMPARWTCTGCELDFCGHCVSTQTLTTDPVCLCCKARLQPLSLRRAIPSFAEKLPLFFRMPFQAGPLAVMVAVSVLWALAGSAPPFSLLLLPIAGTVFSISASRLSHRISQGWLEEPPMPLPDQPGLGNVFKQGLVFLVLFGVAGYVGAALHSPVLLLAMMAIGLLLAPAAVITVIVTDRLGLALNPLHLLLFASRMGWPYLLMWFLLVTLYAGGHQLLGWLVQHFPLAVGLGVNGFVTSYSGYVIAALMGYVAYQQHEELGQPVRDVTGELHGSGKALSPRPDRAQLLMLLGKPAEAADELRRELDKQPDSLELHERYHRLLLMGRDAQTVLPHADFYIGRLIAAKRDDRAFEVYQSCAEKLGPVEIREGEDCVRLAAVARQRGKWALMAALLSRFGSRFPAHPATPRALLLSAQMLSEGQNDDAKALTLLQALIARFPQDPVHAEAERTLRSVERMLQRRAAVPPTAGSSG